MLFIGVHLHPVPYPRFPGPHSEQTEEKEMKILIYKSSEEPFFNSIALQP
jgi:hypothetical protein